MCALPDAVVDRRDALAAKDTHVCARGAKSVQNALATALRVATAWTVLFLFALSRVLEGIALRKTSTSTAGKSCNTVRSRDDARWTCSNEKFTNVVQVDTIESRNVYAATKAQQVQRKLQ